MLSNVGFDTDPVFFEVEKFPRFLSPARYRAMWCVIILEKEENEEGKRVKLEKWERNVDNYRRLE